MKRKKPAIPWDEVVKNLSEEELMKAAEGLGGELNCLIAAEIRKEIDACLIESMLTGMPPKGLEPMNIPDTPEWKAWAENQKKMGDIGTELLKKHESTNQKDK
jgi:hypothetical protein